MLPCQCCFALCSLCLPSHCCAWPCNSTPQPGKPGVAARVPKPIPRMPSRSLCGAAYRCLEAYMHAVYTPCRCTSSSNGQHCTGQRALHNAQQTPSRPPKFRPACSVLHVCQPLLFMRALRHLSRCIAMNICHGNGYLRARLIRVMDRGVVGTEWYAAGLPASAVNTEMLGCLQLSRNASVADAPRRRWGKAQLCLGPYIAPFPRQYSSLRASVCTLLCRTALSLETSKEPHSATQVRRRIP